MVERPGSGRNGSSAQRSVEIPPGVRTTRLIAYVQGALGALNGALLVFGGAAYATVAGVRGAGGTALYVGIGLLVLAVSVLLIWAGRLLGRLSRRARLGILAFQYISIVLGLLSYNDPLQAAVRIVLAAVAIYYLQFDSRTRAAFAAPPAA